jgi:hypothetical protein
LFFSKSWLYLFLDLLSPFGIAALVTFAAGPLLMSGCIELTIPLIIGSVLAADTAFLRFDGFPCFTYLLSDCAAIENTPR